MYVLQANPEMHRVEARLLNPPKLQGSRPYAMNQPGAANT